MKKTVLLACLAIAIIFSFGSCKKNNESSSYIKGSIDGAAFECTSGIQANKPMPLPSGPSDPSLFIKGIWDGYSIKLLLNEQASGRSLSTGTYTFESGKDGSATIWQNNTESFYAGSSSFCFGCPITLSGRGTITISEISKNHVKGSFEFVTGVNMPTSTIKTVTNGEFYVKRS